jgi:hypothetical protein
VVLLRAVVTIGALVGFVRAVRTGIVDAFDVRAGTVIVRVSAGVVREGRWGYVLVAVVVVVRGVVVFGVVTVVVVGVVVNVVVVVGMAVQVAPS